MGLRHAPMIVARTSETDPLSKRGKCGRRGVIIPFESMKTRRFVPLISLVATLACGGDADFDTPGEAAEFQSYFQPATPYRDQECSRHDGALRGQRELVLYRGGLTTDSVGLFRFTSGLQRYYDRHDLRFFTRTPPRPLALDSILNLNEAQLNAELKKKFPGIDPDSASLTDAEMHAVSIFALNFVLRPIIDFSRSFGTRGENKTNLVVLPHLLSNASKSALGTEGQLAGLAVSPALIEAIINSETLDSEAQLWRDAEFPPGFTPMLFLDASVLDMATKFEESGGDLVAAHEFGHTASLIHREDEKNLMKPSLDRSSISCTSPLYPDQLESMRRVLNVGNSPVAATGPRKPSTQRLSAGLDSSDRGRGIRSLRAFMRGETADVPAMLKPILHLH